MRKTKEEAEKTRNSILKAAIKVFNKKGFTATKLDDIAKKANVTRGAIYWHFKNKEDLIKALCNENKSKAMAIINSILETEPNPLLALKKGLKETFLKIYTDKEFRLVEELMFKATFKGEINFLIKDHQQRDEEQLNIVKKILLKAQDQNLISKETNIEIATFIIASFFFGSMVIALVHTHLFSFENNIDEYIDTFIRGIENKTNINRG